MEIEITEKTAFTHSHYGWEGSTFMKINGFLYEVSTMKRHNNEIMSIAQKLSSRTRGNSFSSVQYTPSQDKAVIILREKAVATEAKIRELHARALEMIPALNDQFPTVPADAPYIPHVGHLIFVDGYGTEDQLMAIYEIKDNMAFYVNTKTLQLGRHELFSIRDYAKKFGIGVYHRQGQAIALDKIQELVITAKAKAKKDVEEYGNLPVPMHIRNAPTKLMEKLGYGKGYKYTPVEDSQDQEYFPAEIKNRKYL